MEYLQSGRGVIYALPHCGDFEIAGAWINAKGAGTFTTVAERLKPESLFQQFQNDGFVLHGRFLLRDEC